MSDNCPPPTDRVCACPRCSEETLAALRKSLEAAMKTGKVRLLDPLPRRVRLRLAVQHRIDGIGIWLCDHGRIRAAEALWRATGGWK